MNNFKRNSGLIAVIATSVAAVAAFATAMVVAQPRQATYSAPDLKIVKKAEVKAATRNWQLYYAMKRVFDFTVALGLIVFLAPLFLAIAVAIKLDSDGPALFKQTRVGAKVKAKGSQRSWEAAPFTIYKFRTMRSNSDSKTHEAFVKALIKGDEATMESINGKVEGAAKYKIAKDTRITKIGAFLRKTSLDELPQLFNVLKGEMSLVGPRPAIPYEVDVYEPHHLRRLEALPGITGWWQAVGRSSVDFETMVKLDTHYVENQSFMMDLKIMVMTPISVLKGKGAS